MKPKPFDALNHFTLPVGTRFLLAGIPLDIALNRRRARCDRRKSTPMFARREGHRKRGLFSLVGGGGDTRFRPEPRVNARSGRFGEGRLPPKLPQHARPSGWRAALAALHGFCSMGCTIQASISAVGTCILKERQAPRFP